MLATNEVVDDREVELGRTKPEKTLKLLPIDRDLVGFCFVMLESARLPGDRFLARHLHQPPQGKGDRGARGQRGRVQGKPLWRDDVVVQTAAVLDIYQSG